MDRPYEADCYRYSAQYLADNAHQIAIRFSRAIQMSPHDHYLTYQYALYLSENKNFTKSGEMFAKAAMISPEDDGIYIEWGNSTFLAGKYDQSAEIYQKLILIRPDLGQAHSNYGFILYSQEKFDEALGRFLKGAELDPRENIAHFNASLVLFHQGREKEGNGHFMNGLKATRTGKYTISSLIGIYNVQVTHCEEKLKEEISQEQRSFLEAKLKGITRIVDLLKRENKIKQLIRNLSDYENEDLEDPILIKYRDSLDNQLINFFKKVFVFKDGVYDGYDNESLKLLDSKCKKVLACPDNEETEVIRVHPKFLEACTSEDQFIVCIHAIAKNTAMLKRVDLLKANDKLGFINEIQEFIESKKSEDSIEEHAFLDCIVIARFLTANELVFEREDFNILEEIYVYLAFYFENALI